MLKNCMHIMSTKTITVRKYNTLWLPKKQGCYQVWYGGVVRVASSLSSSIPSFRCDCPPQLHKVTTHPESVYSLHLEPSNSHSIVWQPLFSKNTLSISQNFSQLVWVGVNGLAEQPQHSAKAVRWLWCISRFCNHLVDQLEENNNNKKHIKYIYSKTVLEQLMKRAICRKSGNHIPLHLANSLHFCCQP